MHVFKLISDYKPTGDQPQAIKQLTEGIEKGKKHQVLLGTTGSGKTYSAANVIANVNKPTLVISHNKTLAAQLYQEFRDYFPENAVEYFVSYYDYYQPESYIPSTDTYIEKDADINEEIDKLRLSTTTSLMTREDVIVVASVSCIYNLGSPAEYSKIALELREGMKLRMTDLLTRLTQLFYERNDVNFTRGAFRVKGDVVDVFPAYQDYATRLEVFNDVLTKVSFFDPLTGEILNKKGLPVKRKGSATRKNTQDEKDYADHMAAQPGLVLIYPAKHYVAAEENREEAFEQIQKDLKSRLKVLRQAGKDLEAYRLKQKTEYDLEMMREIGYCKGIENYSRYFDGRSPGEAPYTLLDFFPEDYLTIIDESHITVPQIRGMHNGDRSRKETLIDYGFRLPSALDNRPLNFTEFQKRMNQVIYTSATPKDWEINKSRGRVIEQIIRPTGIVDPEIQVLPTENQVPDLLQRIKERIDRKERVLVTTLTKKMAEELANYFIEKGIKATYLHSNIDTLERTDILDDLRKGKHDVLVGINLLREGLDLPEVSLVAILDADKEGFLRSEGALIQIMGRAARHISGEVVMYADNMTGSMQRAIDEVNRRREIQLAYNEEHNITPQQIVKPIRERLIQQLSSEKGDEEAVLKQELSQLPPDELEEERARLEKLMHYEAEVLNFEKAAEYRDLIRKINKLIV
ncbi:excinuclease ABC subunit B [candidate division WWE3 bacterium]|nr:excinuclease ABC subunit B [candidate division WWE3 bacterium]